MSSDRPPSPQAAPSGSGAGQPRDAGPGTLYIVSAPSGAGKTSLVRTLLETVPGLELSVSHTTRAPRPGEVDGVDYHFTDEARFTALVDQGRFLEHARVFGNLYGTSRDAVEARLAAGADVILEIDWQGAQQVRPLLPEAVSVFILPPSRAELQRRLRGRGQDDEATLARRTEEAAAELAHYAEYDYLVVNDDFERARADLEALIRSQRLRRARQEHALRGILDELLEGTPSPG